MCPSIQSFVVVSLIATTFCINGCRASGTIRNKWSLLLFLGVPALRGAHIRGSRSRRNACAEDIGKRRLYQNPTARVDEIGKCHLNILLSFADTVHFIMLLSVFRCVLQRC